MHTASPIPHKDFNHIVYMERYNPSKNPQGTSNKKYEVRKRSRVRISISQTTGQAAHIDTSRVVVPRASSPAASRGMTGSLQFQPGTVITGHDAHVGRPRLVNRFEATKVVVEIAANDRRQPPHEADVVLQPFHVEPLPSANFFGAGLALHAIVEIAANAHRQPPHEADVMLQAFHVEPLPTANFSGAGLALHAVTEITVNGRRQPPHAADVGMQTLHFELLPPANYFSATDIVTKIAADLLFEISVNDRMWSPHEADRWLQAFHHDEEGLRPVIFFRRSRHCH